MGPVLGLWLALGLGDSGCEALADASGADEAVNEEKYMRQQGGWWNATALLCDDHAICKAPFRDFWILVPPLRASKPSDVCRRLVAGVRRKHHDGCVDSVRAQARKDECLSAETENSCMGMPGNLLHHSGGFWRSVRFKYGV